MQSMNVGPLVPDFLSSECFTAPDACDWSYGMSDGFDISNWDVDCFGHGQLGDVPAGDPIICQVPDAGQLLAEELSMASSTMTSLQLATFSPTSPAQVQRDDAVCSPTAGGQSDLGAGTGSVVTCSGGARPKLQLDYGNVLSAWQAMGGSIAVGEEVSASSSVTLRLPAASDSISSALPSYNMCHAPRVLPLPLGTTDASPKLRDNSLMLGSFAGGDGGAPMRRASMQSTAGSRLGTALADDLLLGLGDSDCGSDDSLAEALLSCGFDAGGVGGNGVSRGFVGGGSLHGSSCCFVGSMGGAGGSGANCFSIGGSPLMPPMPSLRSAAYSCSALSALCMPGLPQSLASIPAKTTECAKSARAACFVRYKEKKQNRKSGKIRYEMRKINAEKRPRFRGRFVKREELMMMLAAEQEELSPRSDASAADCAPLWRFNQ